MCLSKKVCWKRLFKAYVLLNIKFCVPMVNYMHTEKRANVNALFSGVIIQNKCNPNPCKYNGVCRTSEDGKRAFCKCPTYKFKAPFCGEYSVIHFSLQF